MKALKESHLFHMLNPADDTGRGYGTTKPKSYKIAQGHEDFPYGWEEESEWDWEQTDEHQNTRAYWDARDAGIDDPSAMTKFTNKVGNAYITPDPGGRFVKDSGAFVDGSTRGVSEGSVRLLMRLIEKTLLDEDGTFRLKSASSERDSIGSDAWPGATPMKYPIRPERRKPRYSLKSVMLGDEDALDRYEGEGDPDDPEAKFAFQEAIYIVTESEHRTKKTETDC